MIGVTIYRELSRNALGAWGNYQVITAVDGQSRVVRLRYRGVTTKDEKTPLALDVLVLGD